MLNNLLVEPRPPKLLDQVRDAIRVKHYSYSTEKTYVHWIRRFILFHNKRHPAEMGTTEVTQFLTHLAIAKHIAAATQNQAPNAIVFLYRVVLQQELVGIDALRAKRSFLTLANAAGKLCQKERIALLTWGLMLIEGDSALQFRRL